MRRFRIATNPPDTPERGEPSGQHANKGRAARTGPSAAIEGQIGNGLPIFTKRGGKRAKSGTPSCLPNPNPALSPQPNERQHTHHSQDHTTGCPHPTTGISSPSRRPMQQRESTDHASCSPPARRGSRRTRHPTRDMRNTSISTSRSSPRSERSGGNVTAAAKTLHISRDTLYQRLKVDEPCVRRWPRSREKNLDLAEGQLLRMIKEGDGSSVRFFLRTVGRHRGYSERLVVEQTPEPAQRPRVDMSAALKALSPDEMMQLQAIVAKLEASARLEAQRDAGERDGANVTWTTTAPVELSDGHISGARSPHPPRSTRSRRSPLPTRSSRTRSRLNPGDVTKPE